jgi:putative DNA primase/helicase
MTNRLQNEPVVDRYQLHNIPKEMQDLPCWCFFCIEEPKKDGAKAPKVPRQRSGQHAKSNDPSTWSAFNEVTPVLDGFDGINFAFKKENRLSCADIDHCRNPETGEIAEWALEIIERIGSYTEVSYSGTGVHIVFRGEPLAHGYKSGDIEVYSDAKFISMTGNVHSVYFEIVTRCHLGPFPMNC